MRVGYACLTVGVQHLAGYRTCTLRNAIDERLRELIAHNLDVLDQTIEYNRDNGIQLFRISSDVIPFGSHPINTIDWKNEFSDKIQHIGAKIRRHQMRVSMHPGQYTVLNSPKADVIARAIDDLRYHADFLSALGLSEQHKIVIHIGGVYNEKELAIERFKHQFHQLDEDIKKRLIIENDDTSYTIEEVLAIGVECNIPVVVDVLHHECNPCEGSVYYWITEAGKTWRKFDGPQKIHYSQKMEGASGCAHSKTIFVDPFIAFLTSLKSTDIDVMLEVKDKNLSAIKINNIIDSKLEIKKLEIEWSRYKYYVLERSQRLYVTIRMLLQDKTKYPVIEFYRLIEQASNTPINPSDATNACMHVWGYFKDLLSDVDKKQILKKILDLKTSIKGLPSIKKKLYELATKQDMTYLLDSYYFSLD